MVELKPCPFCGGKAVNCTKQYDGRICRYRIQCDNAGCACRTPWLCYQEDAAEVWNKRTENETKDVKDGQMCETCRYYDSKTYWCSQRNDTTYSPNCSSYQVKED